jgi:hypothetical protein
MFKSKTDITENTGLFAVSSFKKHFDLQITPGGWRPPDKA